MSFHRAWLPVRSTAWAVLLAWLCVVGASMAASSMLASLSRHGVEHLCSGEAVPQWAPSPIAQVHEGEQAALHHLLDCPLCLPALAPPGGAWSTPAGEVVQAAPQQGPYAGVTGRATPWPPARGPPFSMTT